MRSLVVIGVGLIVMLGGAVLLLSPWYQAAQWQASPEAAQAERNAAAPTPVWLTPAPVATPAPVLTPALVATPVPQTRSPGDVAPQAASRSAAAPLPTAASQPMLSTPITLQARIDPPPTATPTTAIISDLQLVATAFKFDNPPEPGAHARLTVSVHNPTEAASGPIVVSLPAQWLTGYRLVDATPGALDRVQAARALRLTFDGPPPGGDATFSLAFVTTAEVIDSPDVTVVDALGRTVGAAHPSTEAPTPRPGPIYSIDIPRLKLHSGVVPVDWEPPLFVVGQVKTSAYVTQGNSVLVGHLRGAAGYNVFDHLDQLQVGDQIVANSRGATYAFAVTETEKLPEDDTSPTTATTKPRLTLMTCAGDWNPLTQDYADRLWVVAEPQ